MKNKKKEEGCSSFFLTYKKIDFVFTRDKHDRLQDRTPSMRFLIQTIMG